MFEVLDNHIWLLVATILESTALDDYVYFMDVNHIYRPEIRFAAWNSPLTAISRC